jgi:hypothetical protein
VKIRIAMTKGLRQIFEPTSEFISLISPCRDLELLPGGEAHLFLMPYRAHHTGAEAGKASDALSPRLTIFPRFERATDSHYEVTHFRGCLFHGFSMPPIPLFRNGKETKKTTDKTSAAVVLLAECSPARASIRKPTFSFSFGAEMNGNRDG